MIKETAVLQERTIVWMREDADLRIGEHKAAYQIVPQVTLNGIPERFLYQSVPGFAGDLVNLEATRHFFPGDQRLEHRIPDAVGETARQCIEALQRIASSWVSSALIHRQAAHL